MVYNDVEPVISRKMFVDFASEKQKGADRDLAYVAEGRAQGEEVEEFVRGAAEQQLLATQALSLAQTAKA